MDDLPEGWTVTSVGEVSAAIQYGYTASAVQRAEGPRFLRITDIQDGAVDWNAVPSCEIDHENIPRFALTKGDIVFARTGATTGKSFLIGQCPPAVFASYLIRLRPRDQVQPEFLAFFFQTPEYWQLISENVAGNAQPNCNASKLAALTVPLPPLAEQRRIVSKLKALLARLDAARQRLAKLPMILKRFRQSVLAAACSGDLTADWRDRQHNLEVGANLLARLISMHDKGGHGHGGKAAEPSEEAHTLGEADVPDIWAIAELRWLCQPGRPITYGILKPGPEQTVGVPYVRVADFPNDILKLGTIRKTTQHIADQYRRSSLLAGDVLLSIRGTVGRTCRVPKELAGANITQDTARITVHHDLSADYMQLALKAPGTQDRMRRAVKGVAVRGINIGDVRVLQIPLPSIPEQDEIVRRVEALFRLGNAIEKRVVAATTRAEKITQAILAKAFRGELVSTEAGLARRERRDYEPASRLLERIRLERENGKRQPKPPARKVN